ncbi:protein unc-13 homolog 4B-like [Culicoides brevitarsis]|uniref:protein unc-13 homolog 4B-like n=1 Tax=Culicoides brevitarsis TaxID=469753 RepID=UPI00307B7E8F
MTLIEQQVVKNSCFDHKFTSDVLQGVNSSKKSETLDGFRTKFVLPCIVPRSNEANLVFSRDDFRNFRYLLFDAVGFNSREIYKKLLLDYYSSSSHVSLTTLQEIFGVKSIKTPRKVKESTQFVNIFIKTGEFPRDKALFFVVYLKSDRSTKFCSKVVETHASKTEWNEHLCIPIYVKKDLRDELIIEVGNFHDFASNLLKNSPNLELLSNNDTSEIRKLVLETSLMSKKLLCKSKSVGKVTIDEEFLGDSHDLVLKINGKSISGELHLQIEVSDGPSKDFQSKEHAIVTKLGLIHDQEINKGTFITSSTEAILDQHRKICHLTSFESTLVRWICLSQLQNVFKFDYLVLDNVIQHIFQHLTDSEMPILYVEPFGSATKVILEGIFDRIHEVKADNHAFSVLNYVFGIKPCVKKEHFHSPKGILMENLVSEDLQKKIEEAIEGGIDIWWQHNTKGVVFECLEDMMRFLDELFEYQEALLQAYSGIFKQKLNFDLKSVLKKVIFHQISGKIEPILGNFAQKLESESKIIEKSLNLCENVKKYYENLVHLVDTDLKERANYLFTVLKRLHSNFFFVFHQISSKASDFWVLEATSKAMTCVERTVDLENFTSIDENVRYSSSSVDFLGILAEFRIFWEDFLTLNGGSDEINSKILNFIQKIVQLFIDLSLKKVKKLSDEQFLDIWITFLHNINHIRQEIHQNLLPTVINKKENYIEDILKELQVEKIFATELILNTQHEMGIEKSIDDFNYDELRTKYEDFCSILHEEFHNSPSFGQIFVEIWSESLKFFNDIHEKAIHAGAHIEFYCKLHETIKSISHICSKMVDNSSVEFNLDRNLERKLFLNSTESDDLIEQYYIERHKLQNLEKTKSFGTLTVSVTRKNEFLEINILNLKDLVPVEWKTSCDPYVKIRFVPLEHFKDVGKYHTKAKSKTTCALFDEKFEIPISKINVNGSNFIHFMIVEKELMTKIHLGDAFLPLIDYLDFNPDSKMSQIHLKLTKPDESSEIIKTLENREHHDKIAKDFLKHLRSQMNHGKLATLQHRIYERQHSISDFIHSHTARNHHS